MTRDANFNPEYVIHSDHEPQRLERQALVYGLDDDLRHLDLRPGDQVLDAGCGPGLLTRAMAQALPQSQVVGMDREPRYLDYARRQAEAAGVGNVRFETGDVLALPFADGQFDVVWSKHLLQWVGQRERALAEMCRVTKPGGRVLACNFTHFCMQHEPTDARLQVDLERWFGAAAQAFGFDTELGRKLPRMFKAAGLSDIQVSISADKAFCGFGGDPERRWNWQAQFAAALPFTTQVFGSEAAAREFSERAVQRFSDPEVFVYCTLVQVQGTRAG